jgi:gas vesicle protein
MPSEASPSPKKESPRRFRLDNVFIPAIAALVGALIGAAVSVFVAVYQVNGELQQASVANLRAQRQAAYQSFLNEATIAADQWQPYTNRNLTASIEQNISSSLAQLQDDSYQVALVGPGTIASQCFIVWKDVGNIGAYVEAGNKMPPYSVVEPYENPFFNDMDKLITEMRQVIQGIGS